MEAINGLKLGRVLANKSEHADNEQELFSSPKGDLNWYVMDALLEEYEPLIDED